MDLLKKDQSFQYLVALACLGIFITISFYNYLLFHAMAELFSIAVGIGIFLVGWNARRRMDNGYLLLVAVAYLFVALLDTLHTLAYKGMGVFPGHGANLPTQLWIAARFLEASALLAAPLLMDRKLHPNIVLSVFASISAVLIWTVFAGWFPDCYIEGQGLTIFKRVSEYVICLVLAAAALLLYRKRKRFDSSLLRLLLWSIAFTIAGELAFTFYVDVYGLSNLVGHLAKIVSFYLIYRAVLVTSLFRPQDILFRHAVEEVQRAKEREKAIQDKLEAIIKPAEAPVPMELADILDNEAIQSLMDDFHALTGIGVGILDLKGNVLVATGWQDICVNYHRHNQETAAYCLESETVLTVGVKPGEFKLYKCKNNMWDMCTPIMQGDRHLGNLFLCQFLFVDEEPDREFFRQQARRYGFNEREYLAALDRLPRLRPETVETVMRFYSKFAAIVSNLSGANFQLAKSNAEKDALLDKLSKSEKKYRKYIQSSPVGIFVADAKGRYVEVNKAACEMLGFSEDEVLAMSITDLDSPVNGLDPMSSFSKVINEGRLQSERRLRHKDGHLIDVLLDAVAIEDGRYMAFCQDISMRKMMEYSLQESAEQFMRMFTQHPLPAFAWAARGEDFLLVDANSKALELTEGYAASFIHETATSIYPDMPQIIEALVNCLEWNQVIELEMEYRARGTGKDRIMRFTFGPIPPDMVVMTAEDITERIRTEKALRESEERFQLAMEASRDGLWDWNVITGDVFFNQRYTSMLGYAVEEFPPRIETWEALIHPSDKESVQQVLRDCIENRRDAIKIEYRLKNNAGQWLWILGQCKAVSRNVRGFAERIAGTHTDITDRKLAEQSLMKSEARLREAQGLAKAGSWEFNMQTGEIWASDEGFRIYGMTPPPSNLLSIEDIEACIPERERVHQAIVDLIEKDAPYDLEFDILPADGSARTTIISKAKLERDENGAPLKVSGVILDITDRKRAEKALEKSEKHLREVVAKAPHPMCIVTTKTQDVEYCNEAFVKTFGYNLKDINAVDKWWAAAYPDPEYRAMVQQSWHDAVVLAAAAGEEIAPQEWRVCRKDGELRDVEFKLVPLGETSVISMNDLTCHKEMITKLREAKESAEVAAKAKSDFLANMSHEIRTPLNGIQGMLQLLQMTTLDNEQEECLEAALNSTKRLSRLLSDILDLSRVEAERLEIIKEPFDLKDAIDSLEQLFAPAAREKGIDLLMEITSELPQVLGGDATRLLQVLSNLVGNAIKFTDKGQVMLSVHPVVPRNAPRYRILFTISDTGIGIADEQLETLFSPFVQAESSYRRRHQGAGLGLAICKRLVALMGGTLSVENVQGQGTTFHVCLPFDLPEPLPLQTTAEVAQALPAGLKVLLAEDDAVTSMVIVKLIGKLGIQPKTVENGRQAVEELTKSFYDLVLMDIQMPQMDGVEATRAIREGKAGERNREIPIIAMTAFAMVGDREKFLAAGMDGYVSKPVEWGVLVAVILQVMSDNNSRKGRQSGPE